ncbi:MAG: DUF1971 domain-containing protein [Acidimicrobiales bacterium]
MPDGFRLVRTTPEFTDVTTPAGLRRAHRVAPGVWGRLRVLEGGLRFVFEHPTASDHAGTNQPGTNQPGPDQPAGGRDLVSGGTIDIPPDTAHRVEPGPGCRFVVAFYEPGSD